MSLKLRAFLKPCLSAWNANIAKNVNYPSISHGLILRRNVGTGQEVEKKPTVAAVLNTWESRFREENIPEPKESIQNILLHVMGGKTFSELDKYASVEMTDEEMNLTKRLCECRLARMPVQYIIGEWDFRDMKLRMAPPVFIPRPETEQMVDIAMACLPRMHECDGCDLAEGCWIRVLEVGCGTGAISLAILKAHPKVKCVAVDQSGQACTLTQENAIDVGVADRLTIRHARIKDDATFDCDIGPAGYHLIISNPPYVPSTQVTSLDPEIVLYEDIRALDGGVDGLRVVRALLAAAGPLLARRGRVIIEVDPSHPPLIKEILEKNENKLNLAIEEVHKDYLGKERFVQLIKYAKKN